MMPRASTLRRAFALPIVLILVLVAGLVITMMMRRHVTQVLTTQREAASYRFHHASKGAQEAVEAWVGYANASRNIHDAIDDDGHAFDLTLDDGQTIRVSLFDAQDTALVELAGLSPTTRDLARTVLEELQAHTGENARRFLRREGPVAISVNSAPQEVLYAAINAVTDGEGTEDLLNEVLHARDQEALTQQSLGDLYTSASVKPELRPRLSLVLTAAPVLWRVEAESVPTSSVFSGRPNRRFCGLILLNGLGSGNVRDRNSQLQRNSMIISWEDCSEQP